MLAGIAQFGRGADQVHHPAGRQVPDFPSGAFGRQAEIDFFKVH